MHPVEVRVSQSDLARTFHSNGGKVMAWRPGLRDRLAAPTLTVPLRC